MKGCGQVKRGWMDFSEPRKTSAGAPTWKARGYLRNEILFVAKLGEYWVVLTIKPQN